MTPVESVEAEDTSHRPMVGATGSVVCDFSLRWPVWGSYPGSIKLVTQTENRIQWKCTLKEKPDLHPLRRQSAFVRS